MKKGFTLIEMLIVIGIIGILSGILIAALSNSTDSAKAAKCLSNMRAIAMAVQARAMSDGGYPLAGTAVKYTDISMEKTQVIHGWIGWKEDSASSGYISTYDQTFLLRDHSLTNGTIFSAVNANREVFVCPLHRETFMRKSPKADLGPCWSYVMNAKFKWQSQEKPFIHKFGGQNYEQLANKSKTLLLAELPFLANSIVDSVSFNTGASDENDPILQYPGCDGDGNEMIAFNHKVDKHDTFAHVCYADGHTERLLLPRNATAANIKELTEWLCDPGTGFDVVLEGDQYKKLEN